MQINVKKKITDKSYGISKTKIYFKEQIKWKTKKMKKGLLLVVVMLATIAVKAQDIYVGGSLNVWRNSTGNTTSFKVAP